MINQIILPPHINLNLRQHQALVITNSAHDVLHVLDIEQESHYLTNLDILTILEERYASVKQLLDDGCQVYFGEVQSSHFTVFKTLDMDFLRRNTFYAL